MAKSLRGKPTQPSFSPDYTEADVLEMWRLRKDEEEESRLREIAETFRTLCKLKHKVHIPSTYKAISKPVITPFVRDAHYRITSSLVAKKPVIHITPKDTRRKDYNEAAAIAERWDDAMIERCNKETNTDIDYNTAAALVRDGESILKVVHRSDAWANFPEGKTADQQDMWKRGVNLPIAMRDVDRLNVLYEGGEYGDTWFMEFGEYSKPFLSSNYSMAKDSNGRLVDPASTLGGKPRPEGTVASGTGRSVKHEFFTSKEWHVLIDGGWAPGFPKPNPYAPYLPYFRAPAYETESLLYSLMFLVPRLDELLTMKLNWSVLGAYPNPVIESVPNQLGAPALDTPVGDAGDAGKGQQKVTWAPGKAIELPYGKTIKFLVPPPVGKDLNDLVIIFEQLIAIAGVPSVMRGMANAGDAGYLYNQMASAATMQYKLAAQSLARQREKMLEFSHWMVGNIINQTVYVQGWTASSVAKKTGKPKDGAKKDWLGLAPESTKSVNVASVDMLGPVGVTYRTTLPTDEQARAMIAMQLTNAQRPLYDVRTALETLMQEEDPDAIMDAISVQAALEEEPLRSRVIEEALRKAGYAPIEEVAPPVNPLEGMVGADGQTPLQGSPQQLAGAGGQVLPPGPTNINPVPLAQQAVTGTPSVAGITRPLQPKYRPTAKQRGVPGATGGRSAGAYPGRPGGPRQ